MIQCLILAGGLGTRMKSVTDAMPESLPKALIPIHGKPFAHHQLEWLARSGVQSVVYSIGYRGDAIRESVGDGSRFGLSVRYVDEGKDLRGTGGAIRLAADSGLLEEDFFVLYGDSYLPIPYRPIWDFYQTRKEGALMTVLKNQGLWDASNVVFRDGRVVLYDKTLGDRKPAEMVYIDYGLSVLSRGRVMREISANEKSDLAAFFTRASREGSLLGYEVKERFYEIGSPQGLADLEQLLKTRS